MTVQESLYERLGGYDAIEAVATELLTRLQEDPQLGHYWAHLTNGRLLRQKQLLVDFLCASAGGPQPYQGRDIKKAHTGLRISESDWNVFLHHAGKALERYEVPEAEQRDIVALVQGLKKDIVEENGRKP